jgi:hypothetical protein
MKADGAPLGSCFQLSWAVHQCNVIIHARLTARRWVLMLYTQGFVDLVSCVSTRMVRPGQRWRGDGKSAGSMWKIYVTAIIEL